MIVMGNNGADTAADFGRLRQQGAFISTRRALVRARRHWYPITPDLRKFVVAPVLRLTMMVNVAVFRMP